MLHPPKLDFWLLPMRLHNWLARRYWEDYQIALAIVWPREITHGVAIGEFALHVTDPAVAIVGAAVGGQKTVEIFTIGTFGRRQNSQGFGAEGFLLLCQHFSDVIDGCVPADLFKFAFPLPADTFQRMGQPILRVDPLGGGVALGADGSVVDGGFVHPCNFCKTTAY